MHVISDTDALNAHYGRPDLAGTILRAAAAAGKDADRLTANDLAPATEFHARGQEATRELARRAGLTAEMSVLDVGGGLGGPARTLAGEIGCRVTVLDLTAAYCEAGALLTTRTGLDERVRFHHGDALAMPFADGSFDVVWTQHSSMNVADKERLYAEFRRVLRPGGRLALHEIMAGPAGPIHLPVPWARRVSDSHLRSPAAVRALLAATGFSEMAWVDQSAMSLEWFRQRVAVIASGSPPLGLHLLLGDDLGPMLRNLVRNLEEERVVVIQGVARRLADSSGRRSRPGSG
jgi:SAM-dependent methyltransferase